MKTRRHESDLWVPARSFFAAIVAVLFFLYSAIPLQATQAGVQCPTAAVQTISVAVRDCCGKVTGFTTRAPKPGEQGFVQCRCAEKKTTTQKATLSSKVPLFISTEAPIPQMTALSLVRVEFAQLDLLSTRSLTPLELPPA